MTNPAARALGSLSRRVRTLIVSALLFLVLLILALTLPVPYVVLSPGPTYNTLGTDDSGDTIIKISGITSHKTEGNLNLTTVFVSDPSQKLTVFDVLSGWLQNDRVVVPKSSEYPPGESQSQVNQQNTQDFTASQDNAVAAAACELGYPKGFGVLKLADKSPAAGKLRPGDVIVSVDGKPAGSTTALTNVMTSESAGATVPVVVQRSGRDVTEQVTLGAAPKGRSGASLGILVPDGTACLTPFVVDLGLANQIGGPSAGLMFALGIMDKVGRTDLTGGRFIAGTGTISPTGEVGPIGGIQLKMIAARNKGATVFLAPAGNCSDVRGAIPGGLQVVKVSSLHEAVQELEALQAHKPVPSC